MTQKNEHETEEVTNEEILNNDSVEEPVNKADKGSDKHSEDLFEENEKDKGESLQQELEETKAKFDDIQDQYLRLQAELQNIQRRNQREREIATRYRSQDLAKKMLPVLDNLERALSIEVEDEAGKNLKKGIEMVLESFNQALTDEGIEIINAEGQPFDPTIHEAYTQVPAKEGQESGTVAQVFEKGYKLHDRILRAAKVVVTE